MKYIPITRRALKAEGFPENLDREIEEMHRTAARLAQRFPHIFGPREADREEGRTDCEDRCVPNQ